MGVTGAHFLDLKPGATGAMVLNWVYDPRRVSPVREGYFAGPSIEDASVITVNAGVEFDGPFPVDPPVPVVTDLFATVQWSSGGKDYQEVEFDLVRGSSISFAAARATVSVSYRVSSLFALSSLPNARVNVTLGRLPSGKRAHRTIQYGVVDPGFLTPTIAVPNFAEALIVHSDQIPLVVRVDQMSGAGVVSAQNMTSALIADTLQLHGSADGVRLTNNGAVAARLSAQYLLSL